MDVGAAIRFLGVMTLATLGLACLLLILHAVPAWRSGLLRGLGSSERTVLGMAGTVAASAVAGSLYFSEVVGFTPCVLCWYQRIAMYPLALVLPIAAWTADRRVWRYALPLAGIGALISSYHVLIQFRPVLNVVACAADVPCTSRYVAVFGFVSIPFMAGAAFLLIGALLLTLIPAADGPTPSPGGQDPPASS